MKSLQKHFCMANDNFGLSCNKSTISSTVEFIVSAERFSSSLLSTFIFKQPFYLNINLCSLDFRVFLERLIVLHSILNYVVVLFIHLLLIFVINL